MQMNLCEKVKNAIRRIDFFSANTTLRVRGQPAYETVCGGFASIVVLITLIAIFATSFFNVLTKSDIIFTTTLLQDTNKSSIVQGFYFSIGIQEFDLTAGQEQVFSLQASIQQKLGGKSAVSAKILIDLYPCEKDVWVRIDPAFQEQFVKQKLQMSLCPKQNDPNLKVIGYEGSQFFQFFNIDVGICLNGFASQIPSKKILCANFANIFARVSSHLVKNSFDAVPVRLLIVDKTIDQRNKQTPAKNFINRQADLFFSLNTGTKAKIYLANFQIETDESILPFDLNFKQQGHYVQRIVERTKQILQDPNTKALITKQFITLSFLKSSKMLIIQREYRTIDDMFSYAGGLFGIIIGFLMFFINDYNQFNYELLVAQGSFQMFSDSREKSFGYPSYLGYKVYEWLNFFGVSPEWRRMKRINQARQQINQQMDVRLILKKINYLQRVAQILLTEHQKTAIYFTKKPTIEQHMKARQLFQASDQLLNKEIQANKEQQNKHDITSGNLNISSLKLNMSMQANNLQQGRVSKVFPEQFALQNLFGIKQSNQNPDKNNAFALLMNTIQHTNDKDRQMMQKIINRMPQSIVQILGNQKQQNRRNQPEQQQANAMKNMINILGRNKKQGNQQQPFEMIQYQSESGIQSKIKN